MEDVLDKPVVFDPSLNNMPVVVTEPGLYVLRNGQKAEVYNIKPYPNADVTAFTVQGGVLSVKGKRVRSEYNIWHPSGRKYVLTESKHDIIRKVEV